MCSPRQWRTSIPGPQAHPTEPNLGGFNTVPGLPLFPMYRSKALLLSPHSFPSFTGNKKHPADKKWDVALPTEERVSVTAWQWACLSCLPGLFCPSPSSDIIIWAQLIGPQCWNETNRFLSPEELRDTVEETWGPSHLRGWVEVKVTDAGGPPSSPGCHLRAGWSPFC